MQHLIDSVENSLQTNNWYSALTLSLTLPDIAGKIDDPAMGSNARYERWYDKYMLHKYTSFVGADHREHVFLSGNDCYALRCAYLHEGNSKTLHQRAREVLEDFQFVIPKQGMTIHCNQNNYKLQLQVDIFCRDITDGISAWLADNANDPQKQAVLAKQLKMLSIG